MTIIKAYQVDSFLNARGFAKAFHSKATFTHPGREYRDILLPDKDDYTTEELHAALGQSLYEDFMNNRHLY